MGKRFASLLVCLGVISLPGCLQKYATKVEQEHFYEQNIQNNQDKELVVEIGYYFDKYMPENEKKFTDYLDKLKQERKIINYDFEINGLSSQEIEQRVKNWNEILKDKDLPEEIKASLLHEKKSCLEKKRGVVRININKETDFVLKIR